MDYGRMIKFLNNRFGRAYNNSNYYNNIDNWLDWYKGYVKSFHLAKISNGINVRTRDIYSLKMAKRVCEDWASSVLNEDIQIKINSTNNKSSVYVQGTKGNGGVLGSNNFDDIISENLEKMFALGTSALVLGIDGVSTDSYGNINSVSQNAKITITSQDATSIIPIRYRNNIITECSFVSELNIKGIKYYVSSSHILEEDGYVIYNDIVDINYNSVSLEGVVLPVIRTKSFKPLFVIFRTNISNNIDLNSPLGVSIYSDAIDNLKGCDVCYDSCIREVITGQRIVMMNKCLLTVDENGVPITPQDNKQNFMQFFGDDANSDINEYIKEFHPTLNTEQLDNELQNQLNMLSSKCGLGTRYYNFNISSGVTATEYTGERNDFMRNSKKMTKNLKTGIKNLILGILYIGKNILNANVDDNAKIDIKVSDGVVESDTDEKKLDMEMVKAGLMSKVEFREKWFGETKEEAEIALGLIT